MSIASIKILVSVLVSVLHSRLRLRIALTLAHMTTDKAKQVAKKWV